MVRIRKHYLDNGLPTLSSGFIRRSFLVSTEEVFRKSKEVLSQQPQLATNILALGWEGNHHLLKLGDNTWLPWESRRREKIINYGVICFNMKIFIIGGWDFFKSTADVDIYSIREKKWEKGPNLTESRLVYVHCDSDIC